MKDKSFLEILKSIFKWLFGNIKNLLIVLLIATLLVFLFKYSAAKKELNSTKIELIETADTLFEYKNKANELYAAKETYIATINDLKANNEELYKEYKNLKDHPIVVEKIVTVTKRDSIFIKDSLSSNPITNTYTATFNFADKYSSISGSTFIDVPNMSANTFIKSIEFPATFTTDIIEKNNSLYFLTKCDNPYVLINNIEGAIISPEQSKMLKERLNRPWGVMVGVGPSVVLVNNTVKIVPALQVTLGYKFISF